MPVAPESQPAGADNGPSTATQPAVPTSQPVDLATWWHTLDDPTLDSLIERAIESNYDLKLATARVLEALALRDIAAADFWPQINASGSYSYRGASLEATRHIRTKTGGIWSQIIPRVAFQPGTVDPATGILSPPTFTFVRPGSGGSTGTGTSGTTGSSSITGSTGRTTAKPIRDSNLYQLGVNASWEMDVWGRIRREVEAATADVQSLEEARRDVMITLTADVALNYAQLRGFQRRLAVTEANVIAQQEVVDLTEELERGGFGRPLDVAQARSLLETTRSQVPVLNSAIRQSIYQLGVLLGEPPEALLEELTPPAAIPPAPPNVPLGLPSDLLRRRPDIRQAERNVASATAQIGVATAALFPQFSLNGSVGPQVAEIRNLLEPRSLSWSVGPSFTWPIFEGGRLRAQIRARNAIQQQTLATYFRTVVVALQDVENALVAYNNERVRYRTLVAAVAANEEATKQSEILYSGGLGPFVNVLEARRSLYATQDALIQSQTTTVTNLIALYRALGGGWDEPNLTNCNATAANSTPAAMPGPSKNGS